MDDALGTAPHDDGRRLPDERAPSSSLPRWLAVALVVISAAVLVSAAYLAVVHVDDRYRIDHVSGVRMALAQRAAGGTLYPELYDGETYGGTRFMPLPIVLHAALADATNEYLVSGKLLSYAAMLALIAVTFSLLRRGGCPTSLSLGLSVLVLTTDAGFTGAMDMRADVLALALQLVSLGIAATSTRDRWWLVAAPIAALAFAVKLSAVWAPIAIVLWLAIRGDRRRLVAFAVTYVAAAAALLAVFAVASEGRIFENVMGLATSGMTGVRDVVLSPYRLFHLAVTEATTGWALIPLAAVAVWVTVREREPAILPIAFVASCLITLLVLTDVGTGRNQLLDPLVLAVVVVGGLIAATAAGVTAGPARTARKGSRVVGLIVAVTTLWLLLSGLVVTLLPDVEAAVRGEATFSREPLGDLVDAGTSVLSEDPYVPLAAGQTPIILDPFMLPRLEGARPGAVGELIERIDAQEFDVIVLLEGVEPIERTWWAELDLGIPVVRAIDENYEFDGITNGYFIYTPNVTP